MRGGGGVSVSTKFFPILRYHCCWLYGEIIFERYCILHHVCVIILMTTNFSIFRSCTKYEIIEKKAKFLTDETLKDNLNYCSFLWTGYWRRNSFLVGVFWLRGQVSDKVGLLIERLCLFRTPCVDLQRISSYRNFFTNFLVQIELASGKKGLEDCLTVILCFGTITTVVERRIGDDTINNIK